MSRISPGKFQGQLDEIMHLPRPAAPVNSPVILDIILQEKLPMVLACPPSPCSGRTLSNSWMLPHSLGSLFNKAVLINPQNE